MTETFPGLAGGKNGFNKYASRMCTICQLTVSRRGLPSDGGLPPERGWICLQGTGLPAPWHSGKSDSAVNRHYLPTTSFVGGNNTFISVQCHDSRVLSLSMWWILA